MEKERERPRNRPERPRNRIVKCRECGGALLSDKDAVTSDNGVIYRARRCSGCGRVTHTKQQPEEFCGLE